MARSIYYGNLMHRAMRGLIQSVLTEVAEEGLPVRAYLAFKIKKRLLPPRDLP